MTKGLYIEGFLRRNRFRILLRNLPKNLNKALFLIVNKNLPNKKFFRNVKDMIATN